MDVATTDIDTLVDIRSVKINSNLPKVERIADYIKQIRNPYHYKCGKITVLVSFSNTNETLEDRFEAYLSSL